MRAASLKVLCVAALLSGGVSVAALAQDAAPPLPANPLPGTPSPAATPQPGASAAASDLQSCLQETGDYATRRGAVIYVIGIANTCDKRLRCDIYANVTGARGTSLGHTVMTLGPASSGAGAKKTYNMQVKAAGGTAQVSRDCKVI
jgi:hypothetical protein